MCQSFTIISSKSVKNAFSKLLKSLARYVSGGRVTCPRSLLFSSLLLSTLEIVNQYCTQIFEATPLLSVFVVVLFIFFYMYGILGIGLLGHVTLPPETYRANDFRSLEKAFLTLFELMIVNDWHITMQAYVDATGTRWVQVRLFSCHAFAVFSYLSLLLPLICILFSFFSFPLFTLLLSPLYSYSFLLSSSLKTFSYLSSSLHS